jgi:hypothetical protein
MTRTKKASPLLLVAASLIGASGASMLFADQVVYFVNGKAMTVKKVEKGDRVTILEVEGGGRIGVPTLQIDRIDELEVAQAAPAVAIPAPAASQPPTAVPAVTPPPAAVPPATSASNTAPGMAPATGPMIGGKPTGTGNNLAGPQPPAAGAQGPDGALLPPSPQKAISPGAMPGAGLRPPGSRFDGAMSRPNAGRRYNGRGFGGPGQGRPSSALYYPPRPPAGQPAAGTSAPQAPGAASAAPAPPPPAVNSQPVEPPAADPAEPPPAEVEQEQAPPEEPAPEPPPDPGDSSSGGN